jgi:hypothetical protein
MRRYVPFLSMTAVAVIAALLALGIAITCAVRPEPSAGRAHDGLAATAQLARAGRLDLAGYQLGRTLDGSVR